MYTKYKYTNTNHIEINNERWVVLRLFLSFSLISAQLYNSSLLHFVNHVYLL